MRVFLKSSEASIEDVFYPGDRVWVFDGRLFKNDVTTPLVVTMQKATVLRNYGLDYSKNPAEVLRSLGRYSSLVDVRFDYNQKDSRGHFARGLIRVNSEEEYERALNAEWSRYIEPLTPGGSEFYKDPRRCALFIKDRLSFNMQLVKENRELKLIVETLKTELARNQNKVDDL